MKALVLSKVRGIYMLRHIIYGIDEKETLDEVKRKYYKDYHRTTTDEFFLFHSNEEMNKILLEHGIKE